MRFNFVLIFSFLLVPAVLAYSDPNAPMPNFWGGAILRKDHGAFNYVVGSFTAPQLDTLGSIAVWVSIDEDGCQGPMGALSSGIVSTETPTGTIHGGFLSWPPNPPIDFDITISTGDHIQVTLNIFFDSSAGTLIFNNLSRGQSITKTFQSSFALCGSQAGWMVGVANSNGQRLPFSSFDSVNITGAAAGARGGSSYGPIDAMVRNVDMDSETKGAHEYRTNVTTYSDGYLNVIYQQGQES